jgi:hypothetical protein
MLKNSNKPKNKPKDKPKDKPKREEQTPQTETGGAGDGGNGEKKYLVATGQPDDNDDKITYPPQTEKDKTPTGKTTITDNLNERLKP